MTEWQPDLFQQRLTAALGNRLATGWWAAEAIRDYHYATTGGGALLWLYHDPRTGRCYRQGGGEGTRLERCFLRRTPGDL